MGDHREDHSDRHEFSGPDEIDIRLLARGGTPGSGKFLNSDGEWEDVAAAPGVGEGAPTNADYLVGSASAGLSNEIVAGPTPGGELAGTWAAPVVRGTHSGSTHAAIQAAAEANASAALNLHITDTLDAHDASAISVIPHPPGFLQNNVQAVLEEIAATVIVGPSARGIEIVNVLPTLPNAGYPEGTVVFLTTDDKLYRSTGTTWTAAVPTVDLTGQIQTAQIVDDAITAGKLAEAAVGEEHIKDQAVLAAKIADNAVTTAKIVDDAINAAKIAAGAVGSGEIVNGAVLEAKLADNAVTQAKVADSAITTAKIVDDAINQAKLAVNAVGPGELVDGAVIEAKIAANAVIQAKIADGAVARAKIVNDAIDASKLADAAVETINIATGAITSTTIADGAISTLKIAAGAVEAGTIAAGAITAGKIAAGAVTAGTIAAGAVTAGTVAADAITATEIAAGAISANELAANAVTAGHIQAGAVDATKIKANTITSDQIAANAITAEELAAGAVTAGSIAAGAITAGAIAAESITSTEIAAGAISADELAANSVVAGKIAAGTVDADAIKANAITAGKIAADAVQAGHIAAGAIQAGDIAAGAVTAGTVAAGAITTGTIAAGAVDTLQLKAGAVTATTIAAGAVEAGKLAAGSVQAGNVAAGAIQAGNIEALAVTAGTLAAGVVTANELAAGSVTTDKLVVGAVTAAKIEAFTITAGQMAANSISAAKLDAITLEVGKYIRGNYLAGSTGWTINADGFAEFNNVTVRGTVDSVFIKASTITGDMGANLIANPGAEVNVTGWSAINGTITRDTGTKRTGAASFSLTATTAGDVSMETTTLIPINPGVAYAGSCHIRGTLTASNSRPGVITLFLYDASSALISTNAAAFPVVGANLWRNGQVHSAGPVPSNARYARIRITYNGIGVGEGCWIDDTALQSMSALYADVSTAPIGGARMLMYSEVQPHLTMYSGLDGEIPADIYRTVNQTGSSYNLTTLNLESGAMPGADGATGIAAIRLSSKGGIGSTSRRVDLEAARAYLTDGGPVVALGVHTDANSTASGGTNAYTTGWVEPAPTCRVTGFKKRHAETAIVITLGANGLFLLQGLGEGVYLGIACSSGLIIEGGRTFVAGGSTRTSCVGTVKYVALGIGTYDFYWVWRTNGNAGTTVGMDINDSYWLNVTEVSL